MGSGDHLSGVHLRLLMSVSGGIFDSLALPLPLTVAIPRASCVVRGGVRIGVLAHTSRRRLRLSTSVLLAVSVETGG